jgi:hypothetical protein
MGKEQLERRKHELKERWVQREDRETERHIWRNKETERHTDNETKWQRYNEAERHKEREREEE